MVHNECVICCDEMPTAPCAVLLNKHKKRSCRHYIHLRCAKDLLRSEHRTCPTCRGPFVTIKAVPDLNTDPRGWFKTVDADGNGSLSQVEVLDLLKTFLGGIEVSTLERDLHLWWPEWDKDGSGELSFAELCDPKVGLIQDIKSRFARRKQKEAPMLAVKSLSAWFSFWDEDGSKSLDKDEIVRALIKTFHLSAEVAKVREMREVVDNIWAAFDFDGSGDIHLDEFVQPEVGLGESLVASLQYSRQ